MSASPVGNESKPARSRKPAPPSPGTTLRITLHGYGISGNHYKDRRQTHVTKEARRYIEHVRALVVQQMGLPGYSNLFDWCAVTIALVNQQMDVDNACKCIFDALQGYAFKNDGHILRLNVEKHKQNGDPRIEVAVCAVDPKAYGY